METKTFLEPSLERQLKGHKDTITALHYSPNEQQIASSSLDNSVLVSLTTYKPPTWLSNQMFFQNVNIPTWPLCRFSAMGSPWQYAKLQVPRARWGSYRRDVLPDGEVHGVSVSRQDSAALGANRYWQHGGVQSAFADCEVCAVHLWWL